MEKIIANEHGVCVERPDGGLQVIIQSQDGKAYIAETSCCICERSIPIYFMERNPNRLCGECRERLKELLYPNMRGEE